MKNSDNSGNSENTSENTSEDTKAMNTSEDTKALGTWWIRSSVSPTGLVSVA